MMRKREILSRVKVDGGAVTRHLSCGHSQPEQRGSKAPKAKWADCRQCDNDSVVVSPPAEKSAGLAGVTYNVLS